MERDRDPPASLRRRALASLVDAAAVIDAPSAPSREWSTVEPDRRPVTAAPGGRA